MDLIQYFVRNGHNDVDAGLGSIQQLRLLEIGDRVLITPCNVSPVLGYPTPNLLPGLYTIIDTVKGYAHPETDEQVTLLRLCRVRI